VWGIGEKKWGGDFGRRMFGSMVEGMERTRGGRESARKIFEMGARSGQRNVMERCKRNRLRVKARKREV
jgi:hypothetical protein